MLSVTSELQNFIKSYIAMASPMNSIKVLLALAELSNFDVHFSITTPYGLVVELSGESLEVRLTEDKEPTPDIPAAHAGLQLPAIQATPEPSSQTEEQDPALKPQTDLASLQIHQDDPLISGDQTKSQSDDQPEPQPEYGPSLPGYKYYVLPDFGTNFLWYEWPGWPGNPEGGIFVEDDDLEERYSKAWFKAYEEWVDRYTESFRALMLDQDYDSPVFETAEEYEVWNFEGALLAAWLALQDGVHQVNYPSGEVGGHKFEFQREGIESIGKTLERFIQSVKLDQSPDGATAGP
ncbi:hypothetical protein CORC01_04224 [Colletotrichum orchidophilum]|uniref:Uncharacterized protein n=1 Tax=Colletotrichum orchidophilum TaxID=1209926 RepID=A0A1G4BGG4_9PEZI|nr:uncharacterized protein CORC01_04224 [Colletotrichum orchidophilum]OHF00474.1 hypothetical protein CORC01_04224 [Colletotrichum orchidophilum]